MAHCDHVPNIAMVTEGGWRAVAPDAAGWAAHEQVQGAACTAGNHGHPGGVLPWIQVEGSCVGRMMTRAAWGLLALAFTW